MIVIDNLHKSFNGQPVLKGISMHIKRGRTGLLSLSGSGKISLDEAYHWTDETGFRIDHHR